MNRAASIYLAGILFLVCNPVTQVLAFENEKTHRVITEASVVRSRVAASLNDFGFEPTTEIEGQDGKDRLPADWITHGAVFEDAPGCRTTNHFHRANLGRTDGGAGLTDLWFWAQIHCPKEPDSARTFNSSLAWTDSPLNEYSWSEATDALRDSVMKRKPAEREHAMEEAKGHPVAITCEALVAGNMDHAFRVVPF